MKWQEFQAIKKGDMVSIDVRDPDALVQGNARFGHGVVVRVEDGWVVVQVVGQPEGPKGRYEYHPSEIDYE